LAITNLPPTLYPDFAPVDSGHRIRTIVPTEALKSVPDRLRIATADEAPALARLVNLAFRVEDFFKAGDRTSPEGVLALMNTGEFLVLDGEDGAPRVTVYVTRNNGRGYFGMLSVDPRLQGQGLAKQVITEVEDRCRRAGCHAIDIYVVDLRAELPGYYRKLGYVESGTREFPDPEELTRPVHLIVMSKALC
jgi:ribosomal protein S18 acetylase RimI-like enzyme